MAGRRSNGWKSPTSPAASPRARRGASAFIGPLPICLWVHARTHLPERLAGGRGPSPVFQEDWSYLPATPANLALLRAPIPAGYPRHGRSAG